MSYRAAFHREYLVVSLGDNLRAFDRASGRVVWQAEVPGGANQRAAVAFGHDAVYATAGQQLVALDYLTGGLRWQAELSTGGQPTIASLLVDGDDIIVCRNGVLDVFDPSGKKRWSDKLEGMGYGHAFLGFPA